MDTVCKSIKDLVDSAHTLWSAPPPGVVSDTIAQLYIHRSGCVPLTFTGPDICLLRYSAQQIRTITSQLHRTKTLSVAAIDHPYFDVLTASLHSHHAASLECLSLNGGHFKFGELEILPTLCGGNTQSLASLSLSCVHIRGLPTAHSLMKLEIYNSQCMLDILPVPKKSFVLHIYPDNGNLVPALDDPKIQKVLFRMKRLWTTQSIFPKVSSKSQIIYNDHKISVRSHGEYDLPPADTLTFYVCMQVANLLDASPFLS
jgi:hypothetical protein